jgi:protein tyrosine phosphatase
MSNTTGEFWKMVYEREVAVIVMLSEFYEEDKVKTMLEFPLPTTTLL